MNGWRTTEDPAPREGYPSTTTACSGTTWIAPSSLMFTMRQRVQRSGRPVEFLRVQCGDTLSFLVSVEEVSSGNHQPRTEPDDPLDGVA
jgi:hypothetical protein